MHIHFTEADQNFICAQMRQGLYASEAEVVKDAIRRLREQTEARQSSFYKAVMKGHEQIAQGQTIPFTRALMQEIDEEVVALAATGQKIAYDPAVIPSEHDS